MSNPNHSRTLAPWGFAVALVLSSVGNALADVRYVNVNCTNATPPYTNWTTAAGSIQAAVDVAVAGDEIVVTNGIYATGEREGNRVTVDKPLTVRSVNGPEFTIINGGGNVRCAYLTNGATICGFTFTSGRAQFGAGLSCKSTSAMVSNCIVLENFAAARSIGESAMGGGVYGGTLYNCALIRNTASGGGVPQYSISGGEASGGGAAWCVLNNCTFAGNMAVGNILRGMGYPEPASAYAYGGGAAYCTLNNCALIRNSAWLLVYSGSSYGGGAYSSTLNNCIVYSNTATPSLYFERNVYRCGLNYCWTSDPLFVDGAAGNLHLQSNSPCINAGLNASAPTDRDMDGNPRIVGGTVDIGAYEYQSLDLINSAVVSNQFGFNVTGQSNWVIVLEASSNFTHWTALTTNTLNGSPLPFRDSNPRNLPQRFYRAQQW